MGALVDRQLVTQLAGTTFTRARTTWFWSAARARERHIRRPPSACPASCTTASGCASLPYSTVDPANALEQEKALGRAGRIATG